MNVSTGPIKYGVMRSVNNVALNRIRRLYNPTIKPVYSMAKDPVFPLYYNDIDRSTKTWTDEEFGAYMRLLMEQWDKGFLPKDYQRLTRIATSLDKNWPMLKDKFKEFDGVLKNEVLEGHREKRLKHKEKQKNNIQKRYQKTTKTLPLEEEKENEKENGITTPSSEFPQEPEILDDWLRWGKLIADGNDHIWEQMRMRKVSEKEMDAFISVAIRNGWNDVNTQQKFRHSLKGFDYLKFNQNSNGQKEPTATVYKPGRKLGEGE